jgi:hypothetical protein
MQRLAFARLDCNEDGTISPRRLIDLFLKRVYLLHNFNTSTKVSLVVDTLKNVKELEVDNDLHKELK